MMRLKQVSINLLGITGSKQKWGNVVNMSGGCQPPDMFTTFPHFCGIQKNINIDALSVVLIVRRKSAKRRFGFKKKKTETAPHQNVKKVLYVYLLPRDAMCKRGRLCSGPVSVRLSVTFVHSM